MLCVLQLESKTFCFVNVNICKMTEASLVNFTNARVMGNVVSCRFSAEPEQLMLQQLQPLKLLCVYCVSSVDFPLSSLLYCCFLREVKKAKSNIGTWSFLTQWFWASIYFLQTHVISCEACWQECKPGSDVSFAWVLCCAEAELHWVCTRAWTPCLAKGGCLQSQPLALPLR